MTRRKPTANRRADIVKTTLDLAFEQGPDRVTTGMIAARLGLTQPAIYKHFPRKGEIWVEIAKSLQAEISANISRALAPEHAPVDRIRMLVRDQLAIVNQTPALPDIMVMRSGDKHHGVLQTTMQTIMEDFRSALISVVDAAKADHSLDPSIDASDAAALVFGVIQSQVLLMLFTRKRENILENGERLLNLQLSSLENKEKTR